MNVITRVILLSFYLSLCSCMWMESYIRTNAANTSSTTEPSLKISGLPTAVPEGYPYQGVIELEGVTALGMNSIYSIAYSFVSNTCSGLILNSSTGVISGDIDLGSGFTCQYQVSATVGSNTYLSTLITITMGSSLNLSFDKRSISLVKGATGETIKLQFTPATPFATRLNYRVTSFNNLPSYIDGLFSSGTIEIPAGVTEFPVQLQIPNSSALATNDIQVLVLENGTKITKPSVSTVMNQVSPPAVNSISVSHNGGSCAISSGALYCWGADTNGMLGNGAPTDTVTVPQRIGVLNNWQKISVGSAHACGIESGSLYCWGDDASGQVGNGPAVGDVNTPLQIGGLTNWEFVAAGYSHTCGIESGSLYCWGSDAQGNVGNGATVGTITSPELIGLLTNWQAISSGASTTCGIESGSLYCWGSDLQGNVGNGAAAGNVTSPTQIGALTNWQDIGVGTGATCGIESGALYCWGSDNSGEVGNGPATGNVNAPVQIGTSNLWSKVQNGSGQSCGINSGNLYCWGSNIYGESGLGDSTTNNETPILVDNSGLWSSLDLGNQSGCGINSTKLLCWGKISGFGLKTDGIQADFVNIGSGSQWTASEASQLNSCGIENGKLYCWGSFNIPTRIGLKTNWQSVSTRSEALTICGISAGELYCWDRASENPLRVGSLNTWEAVSVGSSYICGISQGKLYCWGYNFYYQMGYGLTTDITTEPTQVGSSTTWQKIAAGRYHTCGIDAGKLFCWGLDSSGQAGNGVATSTNVPSPVQIGSSTTWESISVDYQKSCGIDAGKLFCWGNGALGLVHEPTQLGVSTTWQMVSIGTFHYCGIDAGQLFCWGTSYSGQFGNGVSTTVSWNMTPTQVGVATTWTSVACGETHTCGIKSGAIACTGREIYGPTLGRSIYLRKPIQVLTFQ